MATAPFTPAFVNRLEDPTHAYRFTCETGEVVSFKFWCCDEPYNFSITKAPVPILSITPDIQCTAVNLTFNVDASYVPLGTLATWDINYGDGTSVNGAWGPPGNQLKQYAAAGTYTVTATVTDTLGNSGSVQAQVLIVDCAAGSVLAGYMYALSQTTGPWLRDMTAVVPTWTQMIRGLSGNWLNGRDLKVDPHRRDLPVASRHVWIATQAGVAKSTDNMATWALMYALMPQPLNTAGDVPASVKSDLDWLTITFNPMAIDEVYVLAGTATRTWIFWTTDGGASWLNWQVAF